MENKFREKLYDFEGTPSEKVWEGISENLAVMRNYRKWIYAGLSVVVICVVAYLGLSVSSVDKLASVNKHQQTHQQYASNVSSIIQPKNESNNITEQKVNEIKESNTSVLKVINSIQPLLNNPAELKTAKVNDGEIISSVKTTLPSKVKGVETEDKDLFPVLKIQIVSDVMPMYIDPMFRNLVMTFRNPEIENNVRENIYQIRGFHFGFALDMNNSYILNQNNYNEFNGKNLATKFTYGNAYSLDLGFDFSSRFGVQTEVQMNASLGQKYSDVVNGMPVSRDINLKYDEVPVFFKYKMSSMSSLTKRPSVVNFIGGFEYGYLESANENLMGTVTDITGRFNHNDISLLAGLEYNLYFGHHFYFALGLRGTYSLTDINAHGWKLEPGTGSTHNMIFGGNFGINYLIN